MVNLVFKPEVILDELYEIDNSDIVSITTTYDSILFADLLAIADQSKLNEYFHTIEEITGVTELLDNNENVTIYATDSSKPYSINAVYYLVS